MKVTVANYAGSTKGSSHKICITCDDEALIREVFGDSGVELDMKKDRILLQPATMAGVGYRWVDGSNRPCKVLNATTRLRAYAKPFGATEVEVVREATGGLTLVLPEEKAKIQKRGKLKTMKVDHKARGEAVRAHYDPASAPSTEMTLRAAVEAVNRHKRLLGGDLALSVNAEGFLKALVEY